MLPAKTPCTCATETNVEEQIRRISDRRKNLDGPQKLQRPEKLSGALDSLSTIQKSKSSEIKELINDLKNRPKGMICCQKPTCAENSFKSRSFLNLLEKNKCCPKKMCQLAAQICEIYKPLVNHSCLTNKNLGQGKYHFLSLDAATSYTEIKDLKKAIGVRIAGVKDEPVKEPSDDKTNESYNKRDVKLVSSEVIPHKMVIEITPPPAEHRVIAGLPKHKEEDSDSGRVNRSQDRESSVASKYSNVTAEIQNRQMTFDGADEGIDSTKILQPNLIQQPEEQPEPPPEDTKEDSSVVQVLKEKEPIDETSVHESKASFDEAVRVSESSKNYALDEDLISLEDVAREATERAQAFRNVEDLPENNNLGVNESDINKTVKVRLSEPEDQLFKGSQLYLPRVEKKKGALAKFFYCFKCKKKENKTRKNEKNNEPDGKLVWEEKSNSDEELDRYSLSRRSSKRDANRTSHIEDPVAAKQQELNNILSNM